MNLMSVGLQGFFYSDPRRPTSLQLVPPGAAAIDGGREGADEDVEQKVAVGHALKEQVTQVGPRGAGPGVESEGEDGGPQFDREEENEVKQGVVQIAQYGGEDQAQIGEREREREQNLEQPERRGDDQPERAFVAPEQ